MPAAMHAFYLHEMYRKNLLAEPGGLSLAGVPIDLGRIEIPTYIVATREDHIAPWQSCFAACGLYGGRRRFVLGASGHIAGIINPPAAEKYGYWTGPVEEEQDAAAWLCGRRATRRLLVERLAHLAKPARRRQEGARARSRYGRAQADRGRTGLLRPGRVSAGARRGGPDDARYSPARLA